MPIRSRATGVLDDADMAMLEQVLAELSSSSDTRDEVDNRAVQLIALFQSGIREPSELLQRMKSHK